MKLNKQLSILIEEASAHGVSKRVMEFSIIPVLKEFAQQVRASTYYIMKNSQEELLITHLSHREKKGLEKAVIYAFLTAEDGYKFHENDPLLIAEEIPVTHLLFQLFTLSTVESLIFLDDSNNLLQGTEIKREEVSTCILKQIQKLDPTYKA